MTRVRFAPAPTGNLFIGSARVALANYLFARQSNGEMLLRMDDLDSEKSPTNFNDHIIQDLQWLGLEWQSFFRQSDRLELYRQSIEQLKHDKFLYPCFESEEELKAKQEFRRKRNQSPIYDRAMLALTPKQRQDAEAGGKLPHWRFRLSGRTLQWQDLILGPRQATLSAISDPILVRADGNPTPLFANVVDDVDHGVTHLIRSEENAGNTAVQIELFEVLGQRLICFGHVPALSINAAPKSAGRRAGNPPLRSLRADGVEPSAITTCLAGVATQAGEALSLDRLVRKFRIADLATAQFDTTDLLATNRTVLRGLNFAAVANRLPAGATEAFWLAIRGGIDLLKEARGWWDVVAGSIIPPVIENERNLLLTAEALLPPEPWDSAVWSTWIDALQHATNRSGEALVAPLRLALTGEDTGPDLAGLLPLIGRPRASSRLIIAAA